jgi:threonine synthase
MEFYSTRDGRRAAPATLSVAVSAGLAPDGGLYVPASPVGLRPGKGEESFASTAVRTLRPFFDGDALAPQLDRLAPSAFDFPVACRDLIDGGAVLELFHGPTAAFKDFGARFLAQCLGAIDDPLQATILVATSGDTGAAVAAACHGLARARVVILYPEGKVAARQAHGLECWGRNVTAYRVSGTFDDCQQMVKSALAQPSLRKSQRLLSANSISLGRWLPQTAYYAWVSERHWRRHGRPIRLIIPTGNLGNAMAAIYLRANGWPIGEIILACNANRVLPDYFTSGDYRPRPAIATIANAMDIGAPSNFERLEWLDPSASERTDLSARSIDDAAIRTAISDASAKLDYVPCPHTATAFAVRGQLIDEGHGADWTIVATAHPAKFENVVEPIIGRSLPIPPAIAAMLDRPAAGIEAPADSDWLIERLRTLEG